MQQTPAHDNVNLDLLSLIPVDSRRVIEVGCANGALARAWLPLSPTSEFIGIDIDPNYVERASNHCTRALAADIEAMPEEDFEKLFPSDCWIFGDCLEHLRNPWELLRKIRVRIAGNGCVVTCIPNAQHWSVQWSILSGNFRYQDSGLLDKTHIRWFTEKTMLEMFSQTGWMVEKGISRTVSTPQASQALTGVAAFATALGLDPVEAKKSATPIQYVFRLRPV